MTVRWVGWGKACKSLMFAFGICILELVVTLETTFEGIPGRLVVPIEMI